MTELPRVVEESIEGLSSTTRYHAGIDSVTASEPTISSINAQLISHGWIKKPLNLDKLPEKDHLAVTTALFDLLGSSTTNLSNFDDLAARHRTLTYEHERLTRQHAQTRKSTIRMESEVLAWKTRCLELEKRCVSEEAKVKELREELARGRKALEGVRIAANHETKKNQIKLDKANAQLLRLSNDASLLTRPQGLIMLNPISGSRAHPVAPHQPSLFEQSVRDLEDLRQGLQEETEAFRHVVVSTGNALREALAARDGLEEPPRLLYSEFFGLSGTGSLGKSASRQTASSTAHPSIADAKIKELIGEISKRLMEGGPPRRIHPESSDEGEATMEDLEERKRWEREQERIKIELEEKVKDLEVEIACVRAKEEEAQRLVDELAKQQAQERVGRKDLEDPICDEAEYQGLREQQRKLDLDRRKFVEASARLDNQRKTLEAERNAFYEERRIAESAVVLALLPSSPGLSPTSEASTTPSSTPELSGQSDESSTSSASASGTVYYHHSPPLPASPSQRLRTPRPASVGKKRVKTPLSRLVLEKAVRQKGKATATAQELERLRGSVLGEGGRKGNDARVRTTTSATKTPALSSSTLNRSTLKSAVNLASSQARRSEASEVKVPAVGRDLTKADGVGPRATARKVWR